MSPHSDALVVSDGKLAPWADRYLPIVPTAPPRPCLGSDETAASRVSRSGACGREPGHRRVTPRERAGAHAGAPGNPCSPARLVPTVARYTCRSRWNPLI